jgi:TP901 family phage tail tape measure protein
MADDYKTSWTLDADDSGWQAAFGRIEKSLDSWGLNFNKMYETGAGIFKKFGVDIDQFASKLGMTGSQFALVGGGVAIAAKALFDLGNEFDEVNEKIAKGTGATGEKLQQLNADFKDLLQRGIEQDMQDVGQAFADINTKWGLTGESLKTMTQNMADFADVTGQSVTQAVAGATDMVNKWGISLDKVPGLLDQLTKASQDSGVSQQELSAILTRSGTQLQSFGLSMTDSIAMFSYFGKQGVNTSSVMMGLNQALAQFSQKGKDAATGFQETVEKIQSAKSPTEAMSIAVSVFGQRAGPELAKALMSGKGGIDDFREALQNAGGTVENTAEASDTLGDKMSVLKNKIKGAFGDAGGSFNEIAKVAVEALTTIWDAVSTTIEPIVKFMATALGNITLLVKNAFGMISALIHGDWAGAWSYLKLFVLNVVKNVLDSVSTMVNGTVDIINLMIRGVNSALGVFGIKIPEMAKVALTETTGINAEIKKTNDDLKNHTNAVLGDIGKGLQEYGKDANTVTADVQKKRDDAEKEYQTAITTTETKLKNGLITYQESLDAQKTATGNLIDKLISLGDTGSTQLLALIQHYKDLTTEIDNSTAAITRGQQADVARLEAAAKYNADRKNAILEYNRLIENNGALSEKLGLKKINLDEASLYTIQQVIDLTNTLTDSVNIQSYASDQAHDAKIASMEAESAAQAAALKEGVALLEKNSAQQVETEAQTSDQILQEHIEVGQKEAEAQAQALKEGIALIEQNQEIENYIGQETFEEKIGRMQAEEAARAEALKEGVTLIEKNAEQQTAIETQTSDQILQDHIDAAQKEEEARSIALKEGVAKLEESARVEDAIIQQTHEDKIAAMQAEAEAQATALKEGVARITSSEQQASDISAFSAQQTSDEKIAAMEKESAAQAAALKEGVAQIEANAAIEEYLTIKARDEKIAAMEAESAAQAQALQEGVVLMQQREAYEKEWADKASSLAQSTAQNKNGYNKKYYDSYLQSIKNEESKEIEKAKKLGANEETIANIHEIYQNKIDQVTQESVDRQIASFKGLADKVSSIFSAIGGDGAQKINSFINTISTGVAAAMKGFLDPAKDVEFAVNLIGLSGEANAEKFGKLQEKLSGVGGELMDALAPILEVIIDQFSGFLDILSPIISILGILFQILKPIVDLFATLVGWIQKGLGWLFNWIAGLFGAKKATDETTTATKKYTDALDESNDKLKENKELFSKAGKAADRYTSVLAKVRNAAASFYEGMQDIGTDIANALIDNFENGLTEHDFMASMKKYILDLVIKAAVFTDSITAQIADIGARLGAAISSGVTGAGLKPFIDELKSLYQTVSGNMAVASEVVNTAFTGYASGTKYATAGIHKVGEAGPELVKLPQGAQVYNATETKNMMSSNNTSVVANFYSPKALSEYEMRRQLRQYNRQLALNGGF